jgi:IS4 transposase
MSLNKIFDRFVDESPVSVMLRGILEYALPPAVIDDLFVREAQIQRQGELLFSTTVGILGLAVCKVRKSVHASYKASFKAEQIKVSVASLYEKLKGTETRVSQALVRESAKRLSPVLRSLAAKHKSPLPGLRLKIIDGNHLAGTERRIFETRTRHSCPLPGQALVVLDHSLRMVTDVFPCEDAYSQERSLLDQVLLTVESIDCWMADRNFCTTSFLFGINDRGGTFLIRQHASTLSGKEPQGKRLSKGRCRTGEVFEQNYELSDPETGKKLLVRRITIELDKPTESGDREIHLLTNVPSRMANASKMAVLYFERWTIENAFQEIDQALRAEVNTLCYPKAALLAFCIALYLYNGISAMKLALHAVHGDAAQLSKLSGYYLAEEISAIYGGMLIAIPPSQWTRAFGKLTTRQFANLLRELAGHVVLSQFYKHPRGPKKPPPKRTGGIREKHVSTARLVAARNQ